jgi:hypothetical protein
MESLRSEARSLLRDDHDYLVGRTELQSVVLPVRGSWLREELRQRKLARAEVLIDRLRASGVGTGELHFFKGELYRVRAGDGDTDRALAEYAWAVAAGDAPAQTFRSIGILRQGI